MVSHRIDIHQEQDVTAWARTMNTTPERLKEAVVAVGDRPEDVLAYLSKSTRRGRVAWASGPDTLGTPGLGPQRRA